MPSRKRNKGPKLDLEAILQNDIYMNLTRPNPSPIRHDKRKRELHMILTEHTDNFDQIWEALAEELRELFWKFTAIRVLFILKREATGISWTREIQNWSDPWSKKAIDYRRRYPTNL